MTNSVEVLKKLIRMIQEQQAYPLVPIHDQSNLVHDLGLASLDIAQLVAMMEDELGTDPFATGATLEQVATVRDMAALYASAAVA